MNTLFENIYDILFAPRAAFRRIAETRPTSQAVLAFLLSVLIPVIPMYFAMRSSAGHFALGFLIGMQLIGSLAMWFLGAAVWGLLAEFFGGVGRSSSLFAALGFTYVPRLLLVPGLMVASLLPSAFMKIVEVVLIAAVSFWTLGLDIAAIREVYAISGAKSTLVLLTPLIVVIILIVVAVISAGTMMMQLPFSFENVLVE